MDKERIKEKLAKESEHEKDMLDGQKNNVDLIYANLPAKLERIEQKSGIDAERLINYAGSIAWTHNMEWHRVLSIIESFYNLKNEDDKKQTTHRSIFWMD